MLVAVMLARWVWVFAAPVSVAMPATTSWKKSNAADNLFGQPVVVDAKVAAATSNYKLVGVFAHPTAGFAVLLIDGKQVGVGLGGTVADGMRLAETHASYVMLERGGVKQRVELESSTVASGITAVTAKGVAIAPPPNGAVIAHVDDDDTASAPAAIAPQAAPLIPGVDPVMQRVTPAQRALMQQELDKFRSEH